MCFCLLSFGCASLTLLSTSMVRHFFVSPVISLSHVHSWDRCLCATRAVCGSLVQPFLMTGEIIPTKPTFAHINTSSLAHGNAQNGIHIHTHFCHTDLKLSGLRNKVLQAPTVENMWKLDRNCSFSIFCFRCCRLKSFIMLWLRSGTLSALLL